MENPGQWPGFFFELLDVPPTYGWQERGNWLSQIRSTLSISLWSCCRSALDGTRILNTLRAISYGMPGGFRVGGSANEACGNGWSECVRRGNDADGSPCGRH